jgi:caa(3)-type oxidase subunit IV
MTDQNEQHGEQGHHGEAHHVNYRKIYITLVVLLGISIIGPHFGIVWVTLITAFGIAVVKANLVVQNFMHLRWEKRIMKWMLATSVVLMALLFAGVAPDVMEHTGTRWVNDAAMAATARGIEAPHHEGEAAEEAPEAEPAGGEAVAQAPQAFDAKGAFTTVCATCHGPLGHGDGPGAAALDPKPANFSDPAFWADKTDAVLIKAIREGGASVGKSALMPAWGALYDQAKAEALLTYIKTLKQ